MTGDSDVGDSEPGVKADVEACEQDWRALHASLRAIACERVALEARELELLPEAEAWRIFQRVGYASMAEYMERELHWGPHVANERLRVARELQKLPLIAEKFRKGELCYSAVRELTRVALPQNEREFLAKAQGRTARDVERMVSGLRRGNAPDDPPDPKLIRQRIFLEVTSDVYAQFRRVRTELDKAEGRRLDDSELLGRILRDGCAPAAGEVTRPAVQVAVTTCRRCKQSFVGAGGEQTPIDDVMTATLTCDAEHIGDLETDDLTRPKSHIPDAIRRKVMHRDGFGCIVAGCSATRYLDVHHLEERQHGGQHTTRNCAVLCAGHHKQVHEGRLAIAGEPDRWTFRWRTIEGVKTATTGTAWETSDEEDSVPREIERPPTPS